MHFWINNLKVAPFTINFNFFLFINFTKDNSVGEISQN